MIAPFMLSSTPARGATAGGSSWTDRSKGPVGAPRTCRNGAAGARAEAGVRAPRRRASSIIITYVANRRSGKSTGDVADRDRSGERTARPSGGVVLVGGSRAVLGAV